MLWKQQEYSRFFKHQFSDGRGRSQLSHFPFRDCKTFGSPLHPLTFLPSLLLTLLFCLPKLASFTLRFDFLCFNTNSECFLFVTDWPDHSYHNENFTFNQNYPARSVSHILNSLHYRDSFQQTLFEKANFIFKLTGPIMVQPPITDFWKSPLVARVLYCRKFIGLIPRCPDQYPGIKINWELKLPSLPFKWQHLCVAQMTK